MHICITRPEWVNAKEMYISIADTLELRLFCIKPLTNPPNVPKFQEHVAKKEMVLVPDTFCQNPYLFYHFLGFILVFPAHGKNCWIFRWIVHEVRFFRVGGSALIFSSDITMCWKFPALKHLLFLVPVNICGHIVSGQSNQLLSFVLKLTHCGLVVSYSIIDLGQHWLVAWWHQAITWTNID